MENTTISPGKASFQVINRNTIQAIRYAVISRDFYFLRRLTELDERFEGFSLNFTTMQVKTDQEMWEAFRSLCFLMSPTCEGGLNYAG